VALPVLLVLTLRFSGVSRLSRSLTLAISISTISILSHNFVVMTNNSRAGVNLLGCLLAVSGDDVLALLNVGVVYDDIIFLMTLLMLIMNWLLMALLVWLTDARKVVAVIVTICWFRLRFTLSISALSMRHNLRVMTNSSRAVVNLFGFFLAKVGHNFLALHNIGVLHSSVILIVASLVVLLILSMTMLLLVSILKISSPRSPLDRSCQG